MALDLGRGRFTYLTVGLATAALALAACGGSSGSATDNSSAAAPAESTAATAAASPVAAGPGSLECRDGKITIGVAKAQSGGASFFDVAGTRGLEIAVDQINAAGGIKGCQLAIISGDSKSDPAIAAQVAQQMIDQGAQILVVPDDFDGGIAAAKVGQEAGLLTLSLAASSTQFGQAVGDLFFSGGITTTELGLAQAQFALDQGWQSTFQVLDPGLAYFTEQDVAYRSLYEMNGGEVLEVATVDSLGGQADFSAVISKIKEAEPAVVQALMVFPGVGTFVKQLRSAGVTTPVLGNVTLQTRELPKLVGEELSNDIYYAGQVYFNGAGIDPNTDPSIAQFAEEYEAKFGQFPEQANAPGAYQTFLAVAQALQQDGVVDAQTAADAIRLQTGVPVPGGILDKWQDSYAIWDPALVNIQEGQFGLVKTFSSADLRGSVQ